MVIDILFYSLIIYVGLRYWALDERVTDIEEELDFIRCNKP
jgi:hypothetical protein